MSLKWPGYSWRTAVLGALRAPRLGAARVSAELAERMRQLDTEDGEDAQGPVLSARQESIAAQLREMIGEGPVAFFSDACLMLSRNPIPQLPRTLWRTCCVRWKVPSGRSCSRFRSPRGRKARIKHQASIRAVLEDLGVSPG